MTRENDGREVLCLWWLTVCLVALGALATLAVLAGELRGSTHRTVCSAGGHRRTSPG